MIGYILFGYAASVLIAFVLISRNWPREGELLVRLVLAAFWPIRLLIVLLANALWLLFRSKIGDGIGAAFALLGRVVSFMGEGIDFVLKPIYRPISPLWSHWLALWPKRKRYWIDYASRYVLLWAPVAIFCLATDRTAQAVFFGVTVVIALMVILGIYLHVRKQANSS